MQHMLRYEEIEMTVKLPEPLIRGTTSSRCISDFHFAMDIRSAFFLPTILSALFGQAHIGMVHMARADRLGTVFYKTVI